MTAPPADPSPQVPQPQPESPQPPQPQADQPPPPQSTQTHYFTTPDAITGRRVLQLTLAGRSVDVVTADGVFSVDRIDLGTRVLLREAPAPPTSGDLLDLGCGWGPLALNLGTLAPAATVWAVDVNLRALELTRENAARLRISGIRAVPPDDVPPDVRFAAIWSNPPIRVGKAELHRMLMRWLPRLTPQGQAHLVVQRHLGADSLHAWLQAELGDPWLVTRLGSAKGYRVLKVIRCGAVPDVR